MNAGFPFADLDVNKFMTAFKLPGFEYEALIEAQKRNIAALQEAGTVAGKSFQAIAQRQVEMAQKGFETALAGVDRVVKADSPEAGAKCQIAFCQQAVEAQVENFREIGEMTRQAGNEVFAVMNKRLAESVDEIAGFAPAAKTQAKPKAK